MVNLNEKGEGMSVADERTPSLITKLYNQKPFLFPVGNLPSG